jgi:phage regulator Rha-like protein
MSNLITFGESHQTMSSLEIAELTGKRHSDVLEAIRNMEPAWEKVAQRKFPLGSYQDAQGKSRPCFELTKTECEGKILPSQPFP